VIYFFIGYLFDLSMIGLVLYLGGMFFVAEGIKMLFNKHLTKGDKQC
jgi:hypothetical protein